MRNNLVVLLTAALCYALEIKIDVSCLKIFEPRDIELGEPNVRPEPSWGHDGVPHYEIDLICNARCHTGVDELWVEWKGYDQSQNGWAQPASLLVDIPALVQALEASQSTFK